MDWIRDYYNAGDSQRVYRGKLVTNEKSNKAPWVCGAVLLSAMFAILACASFWM